MSKIVLATRPQKSNGNWIALLREHGFDARAFPLLTIQPLVEPEKVNIIATKVRDLDLYQKLIFVSQNAVECAFEYIENYWPQFPVGVDCFGVGKKTIEAIRYHVDTSAALVDGATTEMTSEGLLKLDYFKNIENQKVLIFRGEGGRTKIQQKLESRAARVDNCALYVREKCVDQNQLTIVVPNTLAPLIVPIFSGEALDAWCQNVNGIDYLTRAKLIVPSERVASSAANYGFEFVIANNATQDAMLEAIMRA